MENSIENKSVGNLAAALAKAQLEITAPKKNKKVDFTDKNGRRVNYSYADLADVIAAAQAALSKNELAVTHRIVPDLNGKAGCHLHTQIIHSSGESLDCWYPLPDPRDMRPQEFGSALTYARRYSYSCIVGVAADEDDDGQIAGAKKDEKKKSSSNVTPMIHDPKLREALKQAMPVFEAHAEKSQNLPPETEIKSEITDAMFKRMFAIAAEHGWSGVEAEEFLKKTIKIDSLKKLPKRAYDKFCDSYLPANPKKKNDPYFPPVDAVPPPPESESQDPPEPPPARSAGDFMINAPAIDFLKAFSGKRLNEVSPQDLFNIEGWIAEETKKKVAPPGIVLMLEVDRAIKKFFREGEKVKS